LAHSTYQHKPKTMFVLNLLAGITAVLGGYYRFLKFSRINDEVEEYKKKNGRIWEKIDNSKFRELPAIVIRWYLRLSTPFKNIYAELEKRGVSGKVPKFFYYGFMIIGTACFSLSLFAFQNHLLYFVFLLLFLGIPVVFQNDQTFNLSEGQGIYAFGKYMTILFLSLLITSSSLILGDEVTWNDFSIVSDLEVRTLVFSILFSNVIFDLLTVFITYFILKRELNNRRFLFLFISLDIIMSACFSIYSIYFGLLGTEQSIDLLEATRMLIGLSPDGSMWQFGSYFWAMHTTFIPTLIYLSVLILMIIAKYITIPVANFFYRASVTEDPYMMYAFFYVTLSGIFLLISFVMGYYLKSPS